MADRFDAIVSGELYADLILSGFELWPRPGQEAFAKEFNREVGGGASITACGMARLGSRIGVLGVVGEDGGWVAGRLRQNGVDTSLLTTYSGDATGLSVAISTPEDRAFLTYPGANRAFPALMDEAAASGQLRHATHAHLAFPPSLDTAADLLRRVRENGCTVSLDVGWHEPWLRDPRLPGILPLLDLFFPNESEAERITRESDPEKALRWFEAAGLRRVAVKLSARGAALLWDGAIYFDAPPPVTPLDTTGAGDCFNAGFLHSWLHGEPPRRCLRAANICGALSTEAYGGIGGMPDGARLNELLRTPCAK